MNEKDAVCTLLINRITSYNVCYTKLLRVAGIYIPLWWLFAVAAFLVAVLVHQKPVKAFWSGFLSLFLLWGGLAWWIDIKNESILSFKMAEILPFGGSSALLILVTGLMGGLIAGFAAMAGSYLRIFGKN